MEDDGGRKDFQIGDGFLSGMKICMFDECFSGSTKMLMGNIVSLTWDHQASSGILQTQLDSRTFIIVL